MLILGILIQGAHESGFMGEHAQEISKEFISCDSQPVNKSGNELCIYSSITILQIEHLLETTFILWIW